MDKALLDVSHSDTDAQAFVMPRKEELSAGRLRVVACTCLMAAQDSAPSNSLCAEVICATGKGPVSL